MIVSEYNRLINAKMTEKELQAFVEQAARQFGYLVYHTRFSIGSQQGFPDLVLSRDGKVIFAELKTEKGKLSPYQVEWQDQLLIAAMRSVGTISYFVWRPSDRDSILEVLR